MPTIHDILAIPHVARIIATQLSITDLKQCSLLCSELNEVFSPYLWSSLTIRSCISVALKQRALAELFVRRGRFLHSLFIHANDLPASALQAVTSHCHSITRFEANIIAVPMNKRMLLFDHLASLSALQRVSFTINGLLLDSQDRLLPQLFRLKNLTDLRLTKGTWTSQCVIDLLDRLPRLRVFHLQAQRIVLNHAADALADSDCCYPNLLELALGLTRMKAGSTFSIETLLIPLLRKCLRLETLWLCGYSYLPTSNNIRFLCDILGQPPPSYPSSSIKRIRFINGRYPSGTLDDILAAFPIGQLQHWELLSTVSLNSDIPSPSWGERLAQHHFSSLEHVEFSRGTIYNQTCSKTWVPTLLHSCPRLRVLRAPANVLKRGESYTQAAIALDVQAAVLAKWVCLGLEELDIPIVGVCRKDGSSYDDSNGVNQCVFERQAKGHHAQICQGIQRQFFQQLSQLHKMRRFSVGYDDRQGLSAFPPSRQPSLDYRDCGPYTQSVDALPWTLDSGLAELKTSWRQLEFLGLAWTAHGGRLPELRWMAQHWPRLRHVDGFWRICDYMDNVEPILFMVKYHPEVKLHYIVPRYATKYK